jgi:hypothetical protein
MTHSEPPGLLALSVAGGYWTGSSAVVDLLREHPHCAIIEGEFLLFSFGQLLDEFVSPVIAGHLPEPRAARNLDRFEEFNNQEPLKLFRAIARRIGRLVGVYPHLFFSPRAGMANRLGSAYRAASTELLYMLRRAQRERVDVGELKACFDALLRAAVAGCQPMPPGTRRVGVFDQLIAPPYIDAATTAMPSLRYINIDRDWRDQYISMRNDYWPMVRRNWSLGVRPWRENYDDPKTLSRSPVTYFANLRTRIDAVKRAQQGNKSVLWLTFEDIVRHPRETARTVFDFLELDESLWGPNTRFHPEVSAKRIRKWNNPNLPRAIRQEIRALSSVLESPSGDAP